MEFCRPVSLSLSQVSSINSLVCFSNYVVECIVYTIRPITEEDISYCTRIKYDTTILHQNKIYIKIMGCRK